MHANRSRCDYVLNVEHDLKRAIGIACWQTTSVAAEVLIVPVELQLRWLLILQLYQCQ